MKYTSEQVAALDAAKAGGSLKIAAFAGAGKTTTLKAIASELKGKGLYTAFNKGIVVDAEKKMPSSCSAKTFHALAYKQFGSPFGSRLSAKLHGQTIASHFNLTQAQVQTESGNTKPLHRRCNQRKRGGCFMPSIFNHIYINILLFFSSFMLLFNY